MHKLVVMKKTGYQITDPQTPVIIRDNRGILFYSTEALTPKVKQFNLPTFGNGMTYLVESGSFKEMPFPVPASYVKLPSLSRRFPSPFDFKILFGVNPNKCTVKWNEKEILFDNSFLEKPLPQIFFILYHEYAHAFFSSEVLCDRMAANYMLAKGFNPSQIGSSSITALSSKQLHRKNDLVQSLIDAR